MRILYLNCRWKKWKKIIQWLIKRNNSVTLKSHSFWKLILCSHPSCHTSCLQSFCCFCFLLQTGNYNTWVQISISSLWPLCPHPSYLYQVSLPLSFICVKQYQEIYENQYLISYSNIFNSLSSNVHVFSVTSHHSPNSSYDQLNVKLILSWVTSNFTASELSLLDQSFSDS